jgi:hypothetical protein
MCEKGRVSRRLWIGALLPFLAAVLAVSCGGDEEPSSAAPPASEQGQPVQPGPLPTAVGTTEMVVDAISGGPIDATRTVRGTEPFDVDIVTVNVEPAYQGYQYMLIWDPEVLAFDGQVDLKAGGLDLCATPATTERRVAAGCLSTAEPTTYAGPLNTVTFHCVGDGTSDLHLLTSEEEGSFTTTLLPNGVVISTALTDASVTCEGVGAGGE